MEVLNTPESQLKLAQARRLMSEALDILDELDAPIDAGSHLDLALHRLESHLGRDAPPGVGGAQELRAMLEAELTSTFAAEAAECPWPLQPI